MALAAASSQAIAIRSARTGRPLRCGRMAAGGHGAVAAAADEAHHGDLTRNDTGNPGVVWADQAGQRHGQPIRETGTSILVRFPDRSAAALDCAPQSNPPRQTASVRRRSVVRVPGVRNRVGEKLTAVRNTPAAWHRRLPFDHAFRTMCQLLLMAGRWVGGIDWKNGALSTNSQPARLVAPWSCISLRRDCAFFLFPSFGVLLLAAALRSRMR